MGDMTFFQPDGTAQLIQSELGIIGEIVIYCELCNEPVAISPVANDEVLLKCIRCHAVSNIVKPLTESDNG